MMARGDQQYRVLLHGKPVGTLHRREDFTRFVLDPSYVNDPNRAVLGLRFEEDPRGRRGANMRLPPWFSNLLPEGLLREWIARAAGVSIEREMGLLARVGHDLPGAVQVIEANEPFNLEKVDQDVTPRTPSAADPGDLFRFSLAGVGLKFSVLRREERFTAPAAGEGGDWILKLPDPNHANVPRNELAMMTLAGAAGIDVPPVKLVHRDQIDGLPDDVWSRGEEHAYAIRRFDRGENRELIHIEDFAQVRNLYPEEKYTGSFETLGALVHRGRDTDALREFARRLAFNVLIGNGDAHLKNWSLIYRDRRTPALAPAYDLVATAVYRPVGTNPEDLGLKFGDTKRFDAIRLSHFATLDARLKANTGLSDLVADFVGRVSAAWPQVEELVPEANGMRARVRSLVHERAAMLLRG